MVTSLSSAEAVGAALHDLRTGGLVEERISPPRSRREPPSARPAVPARDTASAPHERIRFRCYLPPGRALGVILGTLRARIRGLAQYGLSPHPARITHRTIGSRRWERAWRAHAKPVRVGRLYLRPSWVRSPVPRGLTVIEIDPGMAFGTGSHASTALCLRVLQAFLPGPAVTRSAPVPRGRSATAAPGVTVRPAVFDIGTGSGILAIAAARCGARRVWAVDNDPVAVAVARENVRRNGLRRRVRVMRGTGLAGAPGRADMIVANLIAETIVPLLARVRRHLRPGGIFVGSGIVASRLRDVERAARRARLRKVRVLLRGPWRAVVYASGASTPPRRWPA